MLHTFLKTLQAKEIQNLTEIAREMHISSDMALKIANDLTAKGYLQEFGADCDLHQNACSDCPMSRGCQIQVKQWFLTEKGRNVVAEKNRSLR